MRWAQAGNPVGWSSESSGQVSPASQTVWPQQGGAQQGDSWKSQEAIHKRPLLVDSSGTGASGFGSSVNVGVSDHPPRWGRNSVSHSKTRDSQGTPLEKACSGVT